MLFGDHLLNAGIFFFFVILRHGLYFNLFSNKELTIS